MLLHIGDRLALIVRLTMSYRWKTLAVLCPEIDMATCWLTPLLVPHCGSSQVVEEPTGGTR